LIIGLIFLGTASGSVIVPILVELVTAVKEALGAKPGANEKGSALFTMFGAIGSILAAIIGSLLYEVLGNRYTSDIFGGLSLLMLIVFFLMNIYPGFLLKKP
jgi:predicted MFS family arabinose efflux permease